MKLTSITNYIYHAREHAYMSGIERDKLRVKYSAEVFTPTELVQEMLDKLEENNPEIFSDPNKTFLDNSCGDGQFLSEVVIRKMERSGCTLEQALRTTYGVELIEKYKTMKFDVSTINPPYKNGLHIDIFNKAFDMLKDGGTIICIHPATPFINRKPTSENGKVIRIKEIVSDYRSELKLVDGNTIFDNAGFFTPLSITTVTKEKEAGVNVIYSHYSPSDEVKKYESLDDVFIHGNDIVLSIRDKIFSKMDKSIEDFNIRCGKRGNFYLKTTSILGNIPKSGKVNPDFYCVIYRNDENDFDKLITEHIDDKNHNQIVFNDLDLAKNGFGYLKTKFVRFCVSLTKLNQNLHRGELAAVPYLDFTQKWDDEKLKAYFELTDEEWEFIDEYIGDWYEADFNN